MLPFPSRGALTIISPRWMSYVRLSAPPPILTMRLILIFGKLYYISLTTIAAEVVPYSPSGKTAITTLCLPTLPSV